jgi:hypothetical protein
MDDLISWAQLLVCVCEECQLVSWMATRSVLMSDRQVGLMFVLLSGETLDRMWAMDLSTLA